jgi:hypothetical protein
MDILMLLGADTLEIIDVIIGVIAVSMVDMIAGRNLLLVMLFPKPSIIKY